MSWFLTEEEKGGMACTLSRTNVGISPLKQGNGMEEGVLPIRREGEVLPERNFMRVCVCVCVYLCVCVSPGLTELRSRWLLLFGIKSTLVQ